MLASKLHAFCDIHDPLAESIVKALSGDDPEDDKAAKELIMAYNRVTTSGVNSESNELLDDSAARRGYIRKRMAHRSRCLAAALLLPECSTICDHLFSRPRINLASIGGASGSDILAIHAMRSFLNKHIALSSTVYDYQPGWEMSVASLSSILSDELGCEVGDATSFGVCSVTECLENEINLSLSGHCRSLDLVCLSYVLVENASQIISGNYSFLRELLSGAADDTVFIVLDASHMLFGTLIEISSALGFESIRPASTWPKDIRKTPRFGHLCKNILLLARPHIVRDPTECIPKKI